MLVRQNLVVVIAEVKTSERTVDQLMVEESMFQQLKKYYYQLQHLSQYLILVCLLAILSAEELTESVTVTFSKVNTATTPILITENKVFKPVAIIIIMAEDNQIVLVIVEVIYSSIQVFR